MSVLLSETIRQTLDAESLDFRKALPIGPCDEYESSSSDMSLTHQLDKAIATVQSKITALKLEQNLRAKYEIHNANANEQRNKLVMANQSKKRKATNDNDIVGVYAASRLTLKSSIRVSTPEERESVTVEEGRLRGLTVREDTMSILMTMLTKLKSDPGLIVVVKDMFDLVDTTDSLEKEIEFFCDFTLLSFARCCVELGAIAVVER